MRSGHIVSDFAWMPKYYFDLQDGQLVTPDADGEILPDGHAARNTALGVLSDIVDLAAPDRDRRQSSVHVRNEGGKTIFSVTMVVIGEWMETDE